MKIELTEQELQIVGLGLGELPFKISNPVYQNIQKQLNDANKSTGSTEDNPT